MLDELIHDRGRGPEIRGTRATIQDMLSYLLESSYTEDQIARMHSLTVEQVAAARSYILSNPETVLDRYKEIESRPEGVNPPEVIERARRIRESLRAFQDWLASRRIEEAREDGNLDRPSERITSFREWLAERETHPAGTR